MKHQGNQRSKEICCDNKNSLHRTKHRKKKTRKTPTKARPPKKIFIESPDFTEDDSLTSIRVHELVLDPEANKDLIRKLEVILSTNSLLRKYSISDYSRIESEPSKFDGKELLEFEFPRHKTPPILTNPKLVFRSVRHFEKNFESFHQYSEDTLPALISAWKDFVPGFEEKKTKRCRRGFPLSPL